ncbi:MAG: hypothetical protein LDL53_03785, partial [Candidatus Hydrogenedens sp.]|nr:hypothetical protein [Candidatus Hydrogenedens sp.]
MRIGNRSRSFLTHGKTLFKKMSYSSNDEVPKEEKIQPSESNVEQENKISETMTVNLEMEIIELGRKISPQLTNLRKTIEESKTLNDTRSWVYSAMSILSNCVEISATNHQDGLKNLFLDMARIIYSADRIGKAPLSIEPTLELYSLLCCIVADFLTGKPYKTMFEQWQKTYKKITEDYNKLGIRLIYDDEEPIPTTIESY